MARAFGDDMWFATVSHAGKPIAAGCGFRWAREFEITWAAGLKSHRKLRANLPLYWAFMERAAEAGCAVYNFGRSTPDGGTHEFKRQWGARDVPLWWYHHARGATKGTPSPDDASYAWGPRLWRHLPLPLANRLGPLIVRALP